MERLLEDGVSLLCGLVMRALHAHESGLVCLVGKDFVHMCMMRCGPRELRLSDLHTVDVLVVMCR